MWVVPVRLPRGLGVVRPRHGVTAAEARAGPRTGGVRLR